MTEAEKNDAVRELAKTYRLEESLVRLLLEGAEGRNLTPDEADRINRFYDEISVPKFLKLKETIDLLVGVDKREVRTEPFTAEEAKMHMDAMDAFILRNKRRNGF